MVHNATLGVGAHPCGRKKNCRIVSDRVVAEKAQTQDCGGRVYRSGRNIEQDICVGVFAIAVEVKSDLLSVSATVEGRAFFQNFGRHLTRRTRHATIDMLFKQVQDLLI